MSGARDGGRAGRPGRGGQGAGPTARAGGRRGAQGQAQGRHGPQGTDRTGHGSPGGRAGQREGGGERGAPAAGRAAGEVHPPPGIQQMPAHHTHHHRHHHHHLYNIDPDAGELVPPHPHDPSTSQPPPRRERSWRGWPRRGGGQGAASTPQAQGQREEPARAAEGARPCDRDWGTVPDPLGEEALPLVGEVYGWLCWANQGTTRGLRNRPFDAVLLRRDGGKRDVPLGGWAAPEDHERVFRSVIRAAWPDREPTWPAFLEGGAVLRITDADANNWLPRALRSALAHWRDRRRNPPPPQPQPPHKWRRT